MKESMTGGDDGAAGAGWRVLVCGGRHFGDAVALASALYRVQEKRGIAVLIHGAARGADTLAAGWAMMEGVDALPFPADWKAHGKTAGPIRNQRMLDEGLPDAVVAFPGGTGTADMVRRALAAGVPVWEPCA
jgi:hypothetical protein